MNSENSADPVVSDRVPVFVNWSRGNLVHDHFDGSQHCVQCLGPCKLSGARRLATSLVRWAIERWASRYTDVPSLVELDTYREFGVDADSARARAVEAASTNAPLIIRNQNMIRRSSAE